MSDPAGPLVTLPSRPGSLAGKIARALTLLLLTVILVSTGLLALQWSRGSGPSAATPETFTVPSNPKTVESAITTLEREVKKLNTGNQHLKQKIATMKPKGLYLVIDTGANHLYMMLDESILLDAVVSTGSGVRLSDPDKPRSWVFDTPRGELSIKRKVNEPIWTKPDWAFVEAGEDLPRSLTERIEEGVLGEYAMDLGDGYLIHGTLFERALGLHVTHGCVRVGSKDLETIFRTVRIGTKVYIV